MPEPCLLIGHRGASRDAPENTLPAFRRAWEDGADGIEADFQLTADGRIVCFHDDTTGRIAGTDLVVADVSLAELHRLDAGKWKGESWSGIRIPTLPEVLDELPPNKKIYIELKSGPAIISPLERALGESRVETEQIRLLAFSAPLVAELKERLPMYRACWLSDYRHSSRNGWLPSREDVLATLLRIGADGLASRARPILDSVFAGALRKAGMELHVWTVDDPATARRMRELGVDSIMTNRPGWLRTKLFNSRQV